MTDIEQKQAIGAHWFGPRFDWSKASTDERAVVLAKQREQAASSPSSSSDSARAAAQNIAESVQRFVRRCLATRDARITALEDRMAALEGEKAIKPRIRLRSVAGDK